MEVQNTDKLKQDLTLSFKAIGIAFTKVATDEQMETYIDNTYTYKVAVVDTIKKILLFTGGMALSGPTLALGLLLAKEIEKVSRLKDKHGNAKKLKAQYRLILGKIDKEINKESDKDDPNEKYIRGLNSFKKDIENKLSKLDSIMAENEEDLNESYNAKLNNMLNSFLKEDFYGVDDGAAGLEKEAMKSDKAVANTPTDVSSEESPPAEVKSDVNSKEEPAEDEPGEDSDTQATDSEEEDDGLIDTGEEDEEEQTKFGNRRMVCDKLLDLSEKLQSNLQILYKIDNKQTNNEKLSLFLENKIKKAIEKINIVIDKQIETIDYNKLVMYDVYFTEIYLTTNEILKTLL